jgi:tRNA nucleotidyltransferase (CCA-adding enzyme)
VILVTTHETADFDCAAGVLAALLLHPGAVASFPGAKSPGVKAYLEAEPGLLPEVRSRDLDPSEVSTLVMVDTASVERIGKFRDLLEPSGRIPVICYDHHPPAEDPPGAEVHRRATGAVSSLMVSLLYERGVALDPNQATFLALGIYEDTGGLLHAGTTPEDLRAVARLVEAGADLAKVARTLARGLTPDQVDLYHAILHDARRYRIRGQEVVVAAVAADRFVPEASVVVQQYVQAADADRMAALIRMEDRIVLIVRSRQGDLDASRLAAAFGGGGHPSAASAVLRGRTLIEAKEALLGALRETLVPSVRAGDLAHPILYTVAASASVEEAVGLMNRHHVNALPVVDHGAVIGALTRQVADTALHHDMGSRAARDLVSAEMDIVPPEADLETLERRLLSRNLRFVLIGDGPSRITGIVTRTSLLRQLYERESAVPRPGEEAQRGSAEDRGLDLAPMMRRRLTHRALELLHELGDLASERGTPAYLVGGVVRDLLLKRENRDLDVVVEGDACALATTFASRRSARLRVHEAFQTATLFFDDGLRIDLASARTEHYRRPAALPEVAPGGLRQDLFRRDFTINALALRLTPPGFGRLADYFGGRKDLREGKIRVLHGLSFIEDPTRALRAVRFAVRLDFEIARETTHLIRVARREKVFDRLSPVRLRREVEEIFSEKRVVRAVELMKGLGLLSVLHPSIDPSRRTLSRLERAEEALGWYRLLYRDEVLLSWSVTLGVLVDELSPAARTELIDRLRPGRAAKRLLNEAAERVRRIATMLAKRARPASTVHEACRGEPTEVLLLVMALTGREETRKAVSDYLSHLRDVKADIDGADLLRAGVRQGPRVAAGLDAALRAKLDGKACGREEQLAEALAALGEA